MSKCQQGLKKLLYKLKNSFEVAFDNDNLYLYLFKSSWNKKIIDKNKQHDYRGFDTLIETKDNWIINTGNYTTANGHADKLDKQLSKILQTRVETNFVSILPETHIGKHWDYYDDLKCNTSIVWKVFGDTIVYQNNKQEVVDKDYSIILNTDLVHDAYNGTKQIQWVATSLVYDITYDEVIEIFSKEGMTFF